MNGSLNEICGSLEILYYCFCLLIKSDDEIIKKIIIKPSLLVT